MPAGLRMIDPPKIPAVSKAEEGVETKPSEAWDAFESRRVIPPLRFGLGASGFGVEGVRVDHS